MLKVKAITSGLLFFMFLVLLFTGIGLQQAPNGRTAWETGWNFFGLSKGQLENMHTNIGYVFSAIVVLHILLNYKMWIGEAKLLLR